MKPLTRFVPFNVLTAVQRSGVFFFGIIICMAALESCSEKTPVESDPPVTEESLSSFQLIQRHIFAKSCAVSGCHAGSSPTGGLSLEANSAYASLVGVAADNAAAHDEGLLRVTPGDTAASFLYMKLAGLLGPDHGERMPLGSSALDTGKLAFVRAWIAAGAPDTGTVADPALLGAAAAMFTPLPKPDDGFQLHLTSYDVPAGANREIFKAMPSPNSSDIFVSGFDVKMRDNSHHFILYNFEKSATQLPPIGLVRDLGNDMDEYFNERNFFLGSQTAEFSYRFPPGIALRLPGSSVLDLNSHYVNPTSGTIKGEVYVNLHTISAPQRIAQNLFWSNESLFLPAFSGTTIRTTLPSAPSDADVYMLTSHMHSRGKEFRIYISGGPRDGQLIYRSTDWHLPAVKTFDPPLRIRQGESLRGETDYYNGSDHAIRYGPTSDDEMCIIIGYLSFL